MNCHSNHLSTSPSSPQVPSLPQRQRNPRVQLKISSTVLCPALKPACPSDSSSSALDFRWLRIMWSITLLGWLIRLIILWFSHYLRSPFFGSGIINDLSTPLATFSVPRSTDIEQLGALQLLCLLFYQFRGYVVHSR